MKLTLNIKAGSENGSIIFDKDCSTFKITKILPLTWYKKILFSLGISVALFEIELINV